MRVGLMPADARQSAIGRAFLRAGYEVVWLKMGGEIPELLVFPMPLSLDNEHIFGGNERIGDWFAYLSGRTIYAGRCSERVMAMAAEQGVKLRDHFLREEEVVLNVIPTVEGALQLAMEHTPFTIHGSRVLVCGFGRIGKLLSRRLQGLGAQVTVAARRESDYAWCRALGYESVEISDLARHCRNADIIFNTVPVCLFTADILRRLPESTLLVDLAGQQAGVDVDYAARLANVILAPGLPAKCAPFTAGEIICRTILNMYKEENTFDR